MSGSFVRWGLRPDRLSCIVSTGSHCLWSGRGTGTCDSQFGHDIRVHLTLALHFFESLVDLGLLNNGFLLHFSSLVQDFLFLVLDSLSFCVVPLDLLLNDVFVVVVLPHNAFHCLNSVVPLEVVGLLLDHGLS